MDIDTDSIGSISSQGPPVIPYEFIEDVKEGGEEDCRVHEIKVGHSTVAKGFWVVSSDVVAVAVHYCFIECYMPRAEENGGGHWREGCVGVGV